MTPAAVADTAADIAANIAADHRVLEATMRYVAQHPDPKLDAFRPNLANLALNRTDVTPHHLPASDRIAEGVVGALPGSAEQALLRAYIADRDTRYWEQTYTADDPVSAEMLASYGFAEIVGKNGPFISENLRTGVGLYPMGVNYRDHHHQAEEIYIVLAGSGTYRLGEQSPRRYCAGDVVYVPSRLVHGFSMDHEPLIVFYIWQGGDMREKSTFV
ncbi:MAG: dimethylsulfonioproprionate lyase family protein [Pseudomonadota bacterium]